MKRIRKITIALFAIFGLVSSLAFIAPGKVAAASINVPVITSLEAVPNEDNALKLTVNLNNTPTADYSIETWNVTTDKKNVIACDPSNNVCTFVYQNLEEGTEYKIKVRALSNNVNTFTYSNYSDAKTAVASPINHNCGEDEEWNDELNKCEKPDPDPDPDKDCENKDEVWDEETNSCKKQEDEDQECLEGQEMIEQEDGTEKCEPITCDEGEVYDTAAKECVEKPVVVGDLTSISLSKTSYKYDGKKHTPSATVKDKNGKKLTKGTDYSLTYSSSTRKNVGYYKVKATGKGDYQGTASTTFKIKPLATKITSAESPSNGKIKVVLKAKSGGVKYEIQYKRVIDSNWTSKKISNTSTTLNLKNGTKYKVRARTYKAQSGYKTLTSSWTSSKTVTTLGKASLGKATLLPTSYTYNGSAKKPSVTVKSSKNVTLKNGTDYTVTYPSGRKNIGKYTVTIKGKGSYSGTLKPTFTINPPNGSIRDVSTDKTGFTVSMNAPTVSVSNLSYQLAYKKTSDTDTEANWIKIGPQSSTDFDKVTGLETGVKYSIKVRTYKPVSSTPYYSSWSAVKTITTGDDTRTDISKVSANLVKSKYSYTGSAIKPSVTVTSTAHCPIACETTVCATCAPKTLVVGTDYKVSYTNNTKIGTASVIIYGIGNYAGTITKSFDIVPNATTVSKKSVTKNSITVNITSNTKNKKDTAIKYRIYYYPTPASNETAPYPTPNVTAKVTAASKTISSLKAGTKYTIGIEAYKKVNGKEYASALKTKNITTTASSTSKPTTKVSGLATSKSVKVGKSYTAIITLTPSNSTSSVTWKSSKTSVATVTKNSSNKKKATVKCKKAGTATITATSNGKKDSTKLTCKK